MSLLQFAIASHAYGINQLKNIKRKLQLCNSSISEINTCIGALNEHVFPETDKNKMSMAVNTPSALRLSVSPPCSCFCCSILEVENVSKTTYCARFEVLIMTFPRNHVFWDVMLWHGVHGSWLNKDSVFLRHVRHQSPSNTALYSLLFTKNIMTRAPASLYSSHWFKHHPTQ